MKGSLKKDIQELPKEPGVYFFYQGQKLLYIGKATYLKSRVASYFDKSILQKRGPIIKKMVTEATSVQYKKTESVLEALILEVNLIKKHQPPYNTKEKSDKSFVYLIITKEDLPRVVIKREKDFLEKKIVEKVKYSFGPFRSKKELEGVLKIVRKIFPFYQYKNTYANKSNLYQQIGLLPKISVTREQYLENINNIKAFFEGKKRGIIRAFEKKMHELSNQMEFEKANELKYKIFALKNISDTHLLSREHEHFFSKQVRIEGYDVAHLYGEDMLGVMSVVVSGEKRPELYRKFNIKSFEGIDDNRALQEVLERRLKHNEWDLPDIIVADGGVAQKRTVEKVLRELGLREKIHVVSVVKDTRHNPKGLLGKKKIVEKHRKDIVLVNSEAHRFSLQEHRKKRDKNFLGKKLVIE